MTSSNDKLGFAQYQTMAANQPALSEYNFGKGIVSDRNNSHGLFIEYETMSDSARYYEPSPKKRVIDFYLWSHSHPHPQDR